MVAKKINLIAAAVLILVVLMGTLVARRFLATRSLPKSITLYGNVDIRQVQLAFSQSERIDKLLVVEGTAVRAGQLVAQLVARRFQDGVARCQADVAEQRQVVARLLAGTRPEEVAQARADLAAAEADVAAAKADVAVAQAEVAGAQADVANSEAFYRRQQALAEEQYVSLQARDDAQRGSLVAQADLQAKQRALDVKEHVLVAKQRVAAARQQALQLAVTGPRKEDIAAAQARLQSEIAVLAAAQKDLEDTKLYAPADGVIQDRILEPGDMATGQTAVFTLALDNPVWVRAYLPEPELGKVALGMTAWISTDSFPGQRFRGWVGFISPVAEFTPKSVETTQLRSQLVYLVRVYACNPDHRLRLGMPATVDIPLVRNPPHAVPARPCEGP
jgi:HlyD family secretion protein